MHHRGAEPPDRGDGQPSAPPAGASHHGAGGPLPLSAPGLIRCSRCGAETPDDAAWCPRCGKPLELEILDLGGGAGGAGSGSGSGSGDEPPPPVETGKDRRPILVALAIVGFLLAGLIVTSGADSAEDGEEAATSSSSTSRSTSTTRRRTSSTARRSTTTTLPPPVAPEPIGARVAMLRDGSMALIDIDANLVDVREVPALDVAPDPAFFGSRVLARGSSLVVHSNDRAVVVPLTEAGPERELAPALVMIPALDPAEVWLVAAVDGRAEVRRWHVDGRSTSASRALPPDWVPVAEVEGGLVLRRADAYQVWDPETGAVAHTGEPGANALAAHGTTVAWHRSCEPPLCTIHLTDVTTGGDRTAFLAATQVDYGGGVFSPDGRWLALRAYEVPSSQQWRPGVAVIDVGDGTARFEAFSANQSQAGSMVWSPDSRWLFLLPSSGAPEDDLAVYAPERGELIGLRLPRGTAGLAVVAY